VLKVGEVVAGSDVPERLRPGQKSLGDGQLAARTPQTPNRTEPDDGRLLSDWQLGSDIVREAIAKSRPLVREAQAVLGEFEIVEATPVNSNKRLVELKTVYKLEATASSFSGQKYGHDLIDETIIYQQTVIIDRLSATVVEVGDAVAGGGNKWAQPQQKNSVDDETLLAGKPETPAWTALDGG